MTYGKSVVMPKCRPFLYLKLFPSAEGYIFAHLGWFGVVKKDGCFCFLSHMLQNSDSGVMDLGSSPEDVDTDVFPALVIQHLP